MGILISYPVGEINNSTEQNKCWSECLDWHAGQHIYCSQNLKKISKRRFSTMRLIF